MTLPCEFAPSYIKAITPYLPGKPLSELERELGIRNAVKLASNENPLGPSPRAFKAMQAALPDLARYPDGSGFEIRKALAEHLKLDSSNVILGNGSNDVLDLVARAFLKPGDNAIFSQHAFAVYGLVTQIVGATGIEIPAIDYCHDLKAMLAAINKNTRIIFIANPNNPTGTLITAQDLRDFVQSVPANVLVVVDEAYYEYLPAHVRANTLEWLKEFSNLIITRTFSKAYGLAGARVGYALAHPTICDLLNRVRQPFNVNSIAMAGALAALCDYDYLNRGVQLNFEGMKQITQGLRQLNLIYIESYANFISFRVVRANEVYNNLLKRGVIVRPIANYGMPDYLRVSIGLKQENDKFLQALSETLPAAS